MTSPVPPGQGWPQEDYGQGYGIAGTGPHFGGALGAATGEAGPSAPPNLPAAEPLPRTRYGQALLVAFELDGWQTLGEVTKGGFNPDTGLPKRDTVVKLRDGSEAVNIGKRVANLLQKSHPSTVSAEEQAVLERAEVTVTPGGKIEGSISLQQRHERNAAALRVAFGVDGCETLGEVTKGGVNPDTGLPTIDTVVRLSNGDLINAGDRFKRLKRIVAAKLPAAERAALEGAGFTWDAEGTLVRMGEAVGGGSAVHASGSASGVVPTYAAQPPAAAAGPSRPWPPSSGPAPAQPSGSAYPYGGAPFPAPAYPYPPVQTPAWPAAQQTAPGRRPETRPYHTPFQAPFTTDSAPVPSWQERNGPPAPPSTQAQWTGQPAGIPTRSVPDPAQAQMQAWQWDEQLAQIPTRSVPDAGRAHQSATAPGQPGTAWATAYDPAAWPGTPYNPTTAQAAAHTVPGAPPPRQFPRLNAQPPHQTGPHTHPTLQKPQQPHPGR
ncbi:hypothetical protein [Streptomyces bauhiniae]